MNISSPIKSVVIAGNLQNDDLIYKLCPSTEFSEGVWNICIVSLAYFCKNDVKEVCEVSSNLVKSQKYTPNSEVELYDQPFTLFVLDSSKGQNCCYFGDFT